MWAVQGEIGTTWYLVSFSRGLNLLSQRSECFKQAKRLWRDSPPTMWLLNYPKRRLNIQTMRSWDSVWSRDSCISLKKWLWDSCSLWFGNCRILFSSLHQRMSISYQRRFFHGLMTLSKKPEISMHGYVVVENTIVCWMHCKDMSHDKFARRNFA